MTNLNYYAEIICEECSLIGSKNPNVLFSAEIPD